MVIVFDIRSTVRGPNQYIVLFLHPDNCTKILIYTGPSVLFSINMIKDNC